MLVFCQILALVKLTELFSKMAKSCSPKALQGLWRKFQKCQVDMPRHGAAWKAWAQYERNDTTPVTWLSGQWIVPPAPINGNDGQTLFFWNGVEPADNSAVLQPVLQWGESAAGGGQYWAVASWYVSATHAAIYTKLITVNPGDVILGQMHAGADGTWVVNGTNLKNGDSTHFSYKPAENPFVYAYEVLEAYSISACSDYPKTGVEPFTNIQLQLDGETVSPVWEAKTQAPITCNEHAKVLSPSAVNILFNS